jgi:phospholipid N-methyltransferase
MTKNIQSPVVLELGPGTGIFTKEILKKLPKDGILIAIELDQKFIDHIEKTIHDDRLKLYKGDALMLRKFLSDNGIRNVDFIVSGLPLGHFRKDLKMRILREIYASLDEGGTFVQFEYFLAGIKSIKEVFLHTAITFEAFNFPPAFVITCRKSNN